MTDLPDTSVPAEVLAAVRSCVIPTPRPPADERDHHGWERHGDYEIRHEPLRTGEDR